MKGIGKNQGFKWFLIVLGAVSGSILGDILGSNFSSLYFLKAAYSIGTSAPVILNLKVFVFTLGLNFNINIMTIIGTIVAIILYRRY
ncbi:MAG: DUF4321 domain-containing protein [Solirubrobacterales bacterium]